MKEKRYQDCNFLEKAWRCRWYLTAPPMFIYALIVEPIIWKKEYFSAIWGTRTARIRTEKMGHYITMDEMKEHLDNQLDNTER